MGKTSIEWTDETWNPVRGCTKISPGCKHCYAETFAERFRGVKGHAYEQGFDFRLVPEKLEEPLHWKRPRMVFVNSMSDLLQDDVPFSFLEQAFAVMANAPQHTFQVLTKRADRMAEFFASIGIDRFGMNVRAAAFNMKLPTNSFRWPLPNVWLGVSVEDQERADERIPHLLKTPAVVRFLSVEPLLGPVDLAPWIPSFDPPMAEGLPGTGSCDWGDCDEPAVAFRNDAEGHGWLPVCREHRGIHWVIVGGESGAGAREMRLDWAQRIVDDCRSAGVPVFVKQLGARPVEFLKPLPLRHHKGGVMAEWPSALRVREFPR